MLSRNCSSSSLQVSQDILPQHIFHQCTLKQGLSTVMNYSSITTFQEMIKMQPLYFLEYILILAGRSHTFPEADIFVIFNTFFQKQNEAYATTTDVALIQFIAAMFAFFQCFNVCIQGFPHTYPSVYTQRDTLFLQCLHCLCLAEMCNHMLSAWEKIPSNKQPHDQAQLQCKLDPTQCNKNKATCLAGLLWIPKRLRLLIKKI